MPNRILKESICISETLAGISAEAERLWWRIIAKADDFGRFDAKPEIIHGQCMTAFLHSVKTREIARWLGELVSARLLYIYEVAGKTYLQIATWDQHQQRRAKYSKYPAPPNPAKQVLADASNSAQLPAYAPEERGTRNEESRHEDEPKASSDPSGSAPPVSPLSPDEIARLWSDVCGDLLPRPQKLTDTRRKHLRARAVERGRDRAWWTAYFARIRASPFCCGDNERGWRADIDWATRSEDVVSRVLEGKYDKRPVRAEPNQQDEVIMHINEARKLQPRRSER